MSELNQLLDELQEKDRTKLASLFIKKHNVYDWMFVLYDGLLSLTYEERQDCIKIDDWLNPCTTLELYIKHVYKPSKPKLKDVK
jgi:hypothetical protein